MLTQREKDRDSPNETAEGSFIFVKGMQETRRRVQIAQAT